jgi:hypothetical protein
MSIYPSIATLRPDFVEMKFCIVVDLIDPVTICADKGLQETAIPIETV